MGIPYKVIDKYIDYHYGYTKDSNGKYTLSSEEYKKIYQNEIDIFNNAINKTKIIVNMINRFNIACLTIGPKKRNLNDDSKNCKDKYLICVR